MMLTPKPGRGYSRTAWDMVGSALGGRVELYERFYLASAARNYSLAHIVAQRDRTWSQVPEFWQATDEITAQYLDPETQAETPT